MLSASLNKTFFSLAISVLLKIVVLIDTRNLFDPKEH